MLGDRAETRHRDRPAAERRPDLRARLPGRHGHRERAHGVRHREPREQRGELLVHRGVRPGCVHDLLRRHVELLRRATDVVLGDLQQLVLRRPLVRLHQERSHEVAVRAGGLDDRELRPSPPRGGPNDRSARSSHDGARFARFYRRGSIVNESSFFCVTPSARKDDPFRRTVEIRRACVEIRRAPVVEQRSRVEIRRAPVVDQRGSVEILTGAGCGAMGPR